MAKTLKDYFPMIRSRKEVLAEIEKRPELLNKFESWKEEYQEEFLDFCTGVRGAKIMYDPFFKEVFNPEYHPERVEKFISIMLRQKVKIRQILPNDSVRITDECTLLITDIVVELEDGSLVNVEIQKIGYAFPGERMACYSADLLLRQYKRVRARRKKKFTYRDMKDVSVIVLFEKSTEEFRQIKEVYVHHGETEFDTGLKLNTLQKYILISLDIFRECKHNKDIKDELDAWLSFLCFDEPEEIIRLIEAYPEFKVMYEEIYQMCLNIEGVMNMFSPELREIDRNTVQYMIEEQEKRLEEQNKALKENAEKLEEQGKELAAKDELLEAMRAENEALKAALEKAQK